MQTKKVGDWTLLETEKSQSFLKYAERADMGTQYYLNYNNHIWQHMILPTIRETNNPCRVAIDVGASYGFMAEGFLEHFEQVYAFELITPVRECLKENLGHKENLTIGEHGLSEETDMVRSYFYPTYTGHCSIEKLKMNVTTERLVSTVVPLDSYGLTNVDFIKLDVEGHELKVLKGAENTLKENRPLVMIEILQSADGSIINAIQIGEFMSKLGYKLMLRHNEDFLFSKGV